MRAKKIDRYGHTGKNYYEKEAYKNFLASKFQLDKTEDDAVDIDKTNESSFREEKVDTPQAKKKSKWLKLKDFFNDHWVVTIIGSIISGVILLMVGGYISVNREQGIQGEKISTIEKNIETLNSNSEERENSFNSLKESFNVFKAEMLKDLDFIK